MFSYRLTLNIFLASTGTTASGSFTEYFLIECHDNNNSAVNRVCSVWTLSFFPPASSYRITITPKIQITNTAFLIFNSNTQAYCMQHT